MRVRFFRLTAINKGSPRFSIFWKADPYIGFEIAIIYAFSITWARRELRERGW